MNRNLLSAVILFFASHAAVAQPYGNEWIPFSPAQQQSVQQYLKIQVWQNAIHHISYNDINQFISTAGIDPKRFQVFYKGREQFIFVAGESDGVFDPSDYIEFYGMKNDGFSDSLLYDSTYFQINPYYSLFTDTAAYFFTINSNVFASNRRMILETDNNFSSYAPSVYFIRENVREFHSEYASGYAESVDASYTKGEGWSGPRFDQAYSVTLPVPNAAIIPGVNSEVKTVLLCLNYNSGTWEASVNGNALGQAIHFGYTTTWFSNIMNTALVASGSSTAEATFSFTPVATYGYQSNSVPFVKASYPHVYNNFSNENFPVYSMRIVPDPVMPKTRLDISNYLNGNSATRWIYVMSGDTIKKIQVFQTGNLYQALVPTFGQEKNAVLTVETATVSGNGLKIFPVSTDPARYARFFNFGYQGLYNTDYLMISHQRLWTAAEAYKNYRSSQPGGGYQVLLADVNELYDQFFYGINKHILALRRFADYTIDTYSQKPKYLFLFGKSMRANMARENPAVNAENLVPTYGDPPSDNIITSRLNDNFFHPELATGRLAARDTNDCALYYEKVTQHDAWLTQGPQAWQKQVLHFGGGTNSFEQQLIKDNLTKYEEIIEDTLYAGHVTTFLKTTSDPVNVIQSQYLQSLIDNGVSIMTFFAHAGGSTFDITTDDPENYNNKDRYPVIIANSCFVGDIHVPARQYSERFIFQKNKGSIAFIASPNIAFINDQAAYTIPLYKEIASYSYGDGIGVCIQKGIDSIDYPVPLQVKSLAMGMTLHGDPALRMYPKDKPDLAVTVSDVSFIPNEISTEMPDFKMRIIVKNFGIARNIQHLIRLTRKFPDGTKWEYDIIRSRMPFADTLLVTVPMQLEHAAGLNLFSIEVDASSPPKVDEITKLNNNVYDIPLLIKSGDIVPVYPPEFAIVPNASQTLKASTSNLFSSLTTYRFELDSVDRFNSPLFTSFEVSSAGGIVDWPLTFPLVPNRVYYWRVANKAILTDPNNYKWNESSFIYIPGKTGWSQAHYSQFKKDDFRNVVYKNDAPPFDTTFSFVKIATRIRCNNSLYPDEIAGHPVDFYIDNEVGDYGGCYNQINVAILDSLTLQPWNTRDHDLGSPNKYNPQLGYSYGCDGVSKGRSRPNYFFSFPTNNAQYLDSMLWALRDSVPTGNYILVYSLPNPNYPTWGSDLRQYFNTLGSQLITTASVPEYWRPIIFFVKKGIPASAKEILADSVNIDIQLDTLIGGNWDKGFITSVTIGPAVQWDELHWAQYPLETNPLQDSITISIIGIDTANTESVLISDIPVSTSDIYIGSIDAGQFPYLKLKAYVQDELLKTPPQLSRWQIYYTGVPEGALNRNRHYVHSPSNDSLQEGDSYKFEIAFDNISNYNFSDSMLVDFFMFDASRNRVNISSPKYKILNTGDYLIASVQVNTKNYPGLNTLWIEVNPRNSQPEQYHFNNLASVNFHVQRDITNPILDVTFDGQHILDHDIVSPRPNILIKLKDENRFIALSDTGKYRVFLTDSTGTSKRIYFENAPGISTGNEKLKYIPASLPDNNFTIEFNPVFTADGIYQLQVQASDEAGNLSGGYDYKISFEVITRSTITEFVNYPNPFSTSTRFVFTLTGSEIPTGIKIQIMTISGKIVREILQDELGPVHIGRNISQFAWDGRDQYGDRLANGVYLYRVVTQINGNSIEHRETTADKFFKKGWGKMYLLR